MGGGETVKALLNYGLFHSLFCFFAFFIFPRVITHVILPNARAFLHITLCIVSLAFRIFGFFYFFSRYYSRFGYQHVDIQSARKTRENNPTRELFSILHYALGKKRELVAFFLAFWNI